MKLFNPPSPKVIVQTWEPLSDLEIDQAFKGCENTQWWRGLLQLIAQLQREHSDAAKGWIAANNALGVARDNGAVESLDELLSDLERRRVKKD